MRDAGLQPERTLLAWRRTALGLLTNAALLAVGSGQTTLRIVLAVVIGALALTLWAAVGAAYRGTVRPQTLGSSRAIALVTVAVAGVGFADAYIVVTHPR